MVAYPGTPLEEMAKERGWDTPKTPLGYAQYSSEFHPLQTEHLSSTQVLAYRDWAYSMYHGTEWYRRMIGVKFGEKARKNVEEVGQVRLHRDLFNGTWEEYYARRGTRGA